ncbi:unnamed protein product, partial [Hapterophycus canaliculatus]
MESNQRPKRARTAAATASSKAAATAATAAKKPTASKKAKTAPKPKASVKPPAAAPKPAAKTAKKKSGPLEVGTDAPPFAVKDQDGTEVNLESFKGKKNVVVFFYPKDNTVSCSSKGAACSSWGSFLRRPCFFFFVIRPFFGRRSHPGSCTLYGL